jgi:hypothetical protein
VIIIVITGLTLAFGDTSGGFRQRGAVDRLSANSFYRKRLSRGIALVNAEPR